MGTDVAFELVVDGTSYEVENIDKAADGATQVAKINTALGAAGVTGVAASFPSTKIVLTASSSTSQLEVRSLGTTQDNSLEDDLADDITQAIARVSLSEGTPLSAILVANAVEIVDSAGVGTNKYGIRLSQPFAELSAAGFALSDSITVSGISSSEKIGLKNATASVVGPRFDGNLLGNPEFDIELISETGLINSETITLTNSNVSSIPDLVDEINTVIDGTSLKDMVVAGLEGRAWCSAPPLWPMRIPSAPVVPASILRITGVNGDADSAVGLRDGMNKRLQKDPEPYVEDVTLDASIALAGTASLRLASASSASAARSRETFRRPTTWQKRPFMSNWPTLSHCCFRNCSMPCRTRMTWSSCLTRKEGNSFRI